jgi:tetratricopeptide (TPR) repeat protein/tRNA A-37 threonylcarbamoyl transferase component Bud32
MPDHPEASNEMIGRTLGHYHILEEIGSGGMGIVYRARDSKLSRDVALKVLATGAPTDETTRRRFRKEALALSQLNHPNIATVYDFDSEGAVDWLVMELVAGNTLSQKLLFGAVAEQELTEIALQIAGALEEAHDRGIVHRDLKSSNIMVTPRGLVKILDFGLALLMPPVEDPGRTRTLSEIVGVAGTIPYMSPEQVLGDKIDVRSDLYSLGVVLYELVAGRRPYVETNEARLIDAILHRTPAPPRELNPAVSPRLEEIILKLLEKKPGLRHQSAKELAHDLRQLKTTTVPPVTHRPHSRRWAIVAAVGVLAVLLALVGRKLLVQHRPVQTAKPSTPAVSIAPRRAIAVLGFKNISGRLESDWLSMAFSEMLTTELAAGGQLRAIPGENIARMRADLALLHAESYGKETLDRIRNNLGTDLVVLGSYLAVGGSSQKEVRLDLRLQDAVAGETLALVSEKGTEAGLLDLISRAGARLRAELRVGDLTPNESEAVKASLPSNPEAARLYSRGLAKLRLFDAQGARQMIERAITLEPKHALAHAALAAAWATLGYDGKANQEARNAFDLSGQLPREQRLAVEARYRTIARDWPKAVETYKVLFTFFPDNLDYGLHLATAQTSSGNGRGTLETIDSLRKLPPPAREDPRIDLAEALAANSLSDFKRSQQAAAQAVSSGESKGARSLAAQGHLLQGQAHWKLGNLNLALTSFEKARQLYAAAGDRWGVANSVMNRGVILSDQGDLTSARQSFEESLATYRQMGNKKGIAAVLASTAVLHRRQGDPVRAMQNYREALKIWREIDDNASTAITLNNLANLLGEQGQLAEARKIYEEALSIFRKQDNRNAVATVLGNLGDVLSEEGNPAKAKDHYEKSLAIFRETGNRSSTASKLANLGDLLGLGGDIKGAREKHQEALNIRRELGEKGAAAESQVSIALLLLQEKRFKDAEALCRLSLEEFRSEERSDDEAAARVALARSLLGQGKPVEAQNEINHARFLSKTSHNRGLQISVALAGASIQAALGKSNQAIKTLEDALAESRRAGLLRFQLEARLALGETELVGGKPEVGRSRLAVLEKEASDLGYRFISQRAAAARKSEVN